MNVSGLRSHDDGWQAAERATAPYPGSAAEDDALPKRDPMARLVPGAMGSSSGEPTVNSAVPAYRDPMSVGATYLAYAKTRPDKRSPYPHADESRNES